MELVDYVLDPDDGLVLDLFLGDLALVPRGIPPDGVGPSVGGGGLGAPVPLVIRPSPALLLAPQSGQSGLHLRILADICPKEKG